MKGIKNRYKKRMIKNLRDFRRIGKRRKREFHCSIVCRNSRKSKSRK